MKVDDVAIKPLLVKHAPAAGRQEANGVSALRMASWADDAAVRRFFATRVRRAEERALAATRRAEREALAATREERRKAKQRAKRDAARAALRGPDPELQDIIARFEAAMLQAEAELTAEGRLPPDTYCTANRIELCARRHTERAASGRPAPREQNGGPDATKPTSRVGFAECAPVAGAATIVHWTEQSSVPRRAMVRNHGRPPVPSGSEGENLTPTTRCPRGRRKIEYP
jgi:hypothetical protein